MGLEPTWSWWMPVSAVVALVMGIWQMAGELRAGTYSRGEAYSPSHLWHQVITYPVMAVLLTWAVVLAWPAWGRVVAVVALMAVWGGFLIWDAHHPKRPHVDFDWPGLSLAGAVEIKEGTDVDDESRAVEFRPSKAQRRDP